MFGVELSPEATRVQPYRAAMFFTYAAAGQLAGLLVGVRATAADAWVPAIDVITVEAVVVQGRSLHIGPWADLVGDGDLGWPLFGVVGVRQSFVAYVRNDSPSVVELRAVVALHGDGDRHRYSSRLRLTRGGRTSKPL